MAKKNISSLGLDISDYKASVKTLVQLLGQDQANAMRKSMKEAIELNNIIGKQTAKISELTKAGNKVVVTFRKWGDGARVLNVQVKELTKTDEKRIASTKKTIAKINELTAAEKKAIDTKKRLAAESKKVSATVKRLIAANEKQVLSWRSIERVLLTFVIRRAFSALILKMREAIETTIEFSKRIVEIQTIAQQQPATFSEWAETLRKVSDAWDLDLLDTANAAYQVLSNQVADSREQLESFLVTAAKFSRVTRTSLEDSVNLLTGALNAYGISSTRAEEVAAKLFKTIELGRVRGVELANSFGRVAIVAAQVGLSLDELLTSISTITIQSVKASETMTLMRGILLKLAKPTEGMTELFDELGVATVEQLVFAKGFIGALEAIEQASKGTVTGLAELLGRIRPTTGAGALTKDLDKFNSVLEEIRSQANLDYTNAQLKLFTTSGEELSRELNELKNHFQKTFGRQITRNILIMTSATGGLKNTIAILTEAVIALSVAGAIAFSTVKVLQWKKAIIEARVAGTLLAGVQLGAISVGLTVGIFAALALARKVQEATDKIKELKIELAELDRRNAVKDLLSIGNFEQTFIDLENLDKTLVETTRQVLVFTRSWERAFTKGLSEEAVKANENLKKVTLKNLDSMLKGAQDYYNALSKLINDTQKDIARLQRSIIDSESEYRDFFRQQTGGSPEEQLKALNKETSIARNLDTSTLENRRIRLERIFELQKEELAIAKSITREQAKQGGARGTISASPQKLGILSEMKQTTEKLVDLKREELIESEKNLEKEKELKKQIEERYKTVFDLQQKLNEAAGRDIEAFIGLGKSNINKKLLEAIASGDPLTFEFLDSEGILKDIASIKDFEIRKEIAEKLSELNKTMSDLIDVTIKATKVRQKIFEDMANTVGNALKNITGFPENLDKALDRYLTFIKRQDFGTIPRPVPRETISDVTTFRRNLKRAKERQPGETIEDFITRQAEILSRANKLYAKIVADAQRVQEELGINTEVVIKSFAVVRELLDNAQKEFDTLKKSEKEKAALTEGAKSTEEYTGALIVAQEKVLKIVESEDENAKKLKDIGEVLNEIDGIQGTTVTELLDNLAEMKNIGHLIQGIINSLKLQLQSLQSNKINKSLGGSIYASLGKPMGTDTVNAMLTPGEFVMNKFAAKRFYSKLVPMNYGLENPKFGDVNSTTIGDINVSVTGGDTSNQTAISIAQELRREIRRGRLVI